MNDNIIKIKRALISVFDKTDIVKLANSLAEHGIEIVSTGGTARLLVDNNIEVTQIDEITKFPEVLGGFHHCLIIGALGGISIQSF